MLSVELWVRSRHGRPEFARIRNGVAARSGDCLRNTNAIPTPLTRIMTLLCIVLVTLSSGCVVPCMPGIPLRDGGVVEGPEIVKRGDSYYLRYRRNAGGLSPQLSNPIVCAELRSDGGYYFFSDKISRREYGNMIERPLAADGFEDAARVGNVYWLDPDGTRHHIPSAVESGGK